MSGARDPSSLDALTAVQRLESALEQRDGARDVAEDALATARAEADRLLADARRAGQKAGRRRSDALVAEAEAEAAAIRADGIARAEELRRRASADGEELIAELTALVLHVGV
jgi:F-type H+-transporting ATPase subunit b